MLLVLWVPVAVQIISSYDCPMLFISIRLCFQEALTLELLFFMSFVVSKSLKWFDCFLNITFILSLISKTISCSHVKRSLIVWINFDCIFICLHAELTHANTESFLRVNWWKLRFQLIEISIISNLTAYSDWLLWIIVSTQFMTSDNFMWTFRSLAWEMLIIVGFWSYIIVISKIKIVKFRTHAILHGWIRSL